MSLLPTCGICQEMFTFFTENTEAATGGVLWKNVFSEMSQNSQENTCARFSFLIKLQTWDLQLY